MSSPYRIASRLLDRRFVLSCRWRVGSFSFSTADDVTKFASGAALQFHQRTLKKHHHQQTLGGQPILTGTYQTFHHNDPLVRGFHSLSAKDVRLKNSKGLCDNILVNIRGSELPTTQSQTLLARLYTTPADNKKDVKGKGDEMVQEKKEGALEVGEGEEEKQSLVQRFKRAYREHGKVLVAVHVATSIVWYSSFYAAARTGLDLVPYMESWGFSETIIKPFRSGGAGDFAVAYLMYKLATPARYTVTLGGTNLAIRFLRSKGHMAPKSTDDSIRNLYTEGREQIKNSRLRRDRLRRVKKAKRDKKKAEKISKAKKQ